MLWAGAASSAQPLASSLLVKWWTWPWLGVWSFVKCFGSKRLWVCVVMPLSPSAMGFAA